MRYVTREAGTVWDSERGLVVATCTAATAAAEIVAALNGLEELDVVVTALEDAIDPDSQTKNVRGATTQVVATAIGVVERWRAAAE